MDDLACRYTLWNRISDLILDGISFISSQLVHIKSLNGINLLIHII